MMGFEKKKIGSKILALQWCWMIHGKAGGQTDPTHTHTCAYSYIQTNIMSISQRQRAAIRKSLKSLVYSHTAASFKPTTIKSRQARQKAQISAFKRHLKRSLSYHGHARWSFPVYCSCKTTWRKRVKHVSMSLWLLLPKVFNVHWCLWVYCL